MFLYLNSGEKKVVFHGSTSGKTSLFLRRTSLQENVEANFSISRSYVEVGKWRYKIFENDIQIYSSPLETGILQFNNIKLQASDSFSSGPENVTVTNLKFKMDPVGKL